jgi:glycosyltransferase involved in cell wall biosynthesis
VRLVLAGDGPERGAVTEILRRDGCESATVFLGSVANPDMPAIYQAADISVLPSFLEATSITGLESMATGLPLVGTRVGGIPALIDDGETGLLVAAGDAAGLAAAIRRLCDNPAERARFGAAARRKVLEQFAWPVVTARTVEYYERVLWASGRTVEGMSALDQVQTGAESSERRAA